MVRERLRRLRLRLLADHPFFGTLLLHAPLRETFEIPTMATDGYAIYYNPTFAEALTDDEVLGVLLHEVLHAAYGHLPRRGSRDPLRWNVAADIVVNGIVEREGVGCLPQGALRDPALQDLPVEEVYALLPEPPPLPQPDLLGEAPSQYESLDEPGDPEKGQGGDREEGGEAGAGGSNPAQEKGGGEGKGASQKRSGQGDAEARGDESPSSQSLEDGSGKAPAPGNLRDYWRRALREAQVAVETVYGSRSQGQGALGASREYREAVEGRLDWRSLLWRFLTPTPTDFGGLDRRFVHQRLYLEALEEWNVRVHVAVDTSGSIGNEALSRFLGEIRAILRAYPRTQAQLYYADAQLYGPHPLEPEGPWPRPLGGGGTDFRPFFRHLETQGDPLGEILAVYLTDGHGDFPEAPPRFPVLWVVARGVFRTRTFPSGRWPGYGISAHPLPDPPPPGPAGGVAGAGAQPPGGPPPGGALPLPGGGGRGGAFAGAGIHALHAPGPGGGPGGSSPVAPSPAPSAPGGGRAPCETPSSATWRVCGRRGCATPPRCSTAPAPNPGPCRCWATPTWAPASCPSWPAWPPRAARSGCLTGMTPCSTPTWRPQLSSRPRASRWCGNRAPGTGGPGYGPSPPPLSTPTPRPRFDTP